MRHAVEYGHTTPTVIVGGMEPLTLAYIAGSIDSDGFITIMRSVRTKGIYEGFTFAPTYYTARIGFVSTEPMVPTLIRDTLGGSLTSRQPNNPAHKRVHLWGVTNAAAVVVAGILEPYLRLKQPQAAALMAFGRVTADQWSEIRATQKPPYRVTPDMQAVRESFWLDVTHRNAPRNRRVNREIVGPGDPLETPQ